MTNLNDVYLANPVTVLATADLLYLLDDPGGTPAHGAIRKDDLFAQIESEIGAAWGAITGTLSSQTDLWNILSQSWIPVTDTWAYATANTFTVSGDKTSVFRRGVKIKLTQTTVKYFSVVSSSYSAPNTTVTITAGGDYSLASAAITSPYYSNAESPEGFPPYFSWTPTFTGFSADPTGTHRFKILPQGMFLDVQHSGDGTSNANTFYFTCPPGITLPGTATLGLTIVQRDNTANVTTSAGKIETDAGGTEYRVSKEYSAGLAAWTTSGGKRIRATLIHSLP